MSTDAMSALSKLLATDTSTELDLKNLNYYTLFKNKCFFFLSLLGRKFTENCQFCFKDGTCKRRQFLGQFFHVSSIQNSCNNNFAEN